MRLATFNILHGRSLTDGEVSTERLVAACASFGADVLCLQEVDRGQPRSGGVDQTAAVAAAMGAAHWRFEPALVGEPGGVWRPAVDGDASVGTGTGTGTASAAYGVGLVSMLPVRAWHAVRLAAAPIRSPVAVPGGRGRFVLLLDEPRVGLVAELDRLDGPGGGGPLVVATTHLSFVPGYNALQLRRLTKALEALGPPGAARVLLGDLNLPGPVPAWVSGWRPLARVATYPGERPSMQLDHVLAHGRRLAVGPVEARPLPLSDHRALVVDLVGRAGG